MKVQRIFNAQLLVQVLTQNDELWDAISEDGSVGKAEYAERLDMQGMYVLALLSGESDTTLHGFVIGRRITDTVIETHVAIDPAYWGHSDNVMLGKLACAWLLKQGTTAKLVASIPLPDKEVLRYAQRVGFQREGTNKKSFRRNGEILDQYYVGMTHE